MTGVELFRKLACPGAPPNTSPPGPSRQSWPAARSNGRSRSTSRPIEISANHRRENRGRRVTTQNFDEFVDTSNKNAPVQGFLHRSALPGTDCLILTHGAGAN